MYRLNKRIARQMFENNEPFYIAGDNVNEYHIKQGWVLGLPIKPEEYKRDGCTFNQFVSNFEIYLERELGRRAAFWSDAPRAYKRAEVYVVQGNYGGVAGWEDLTESEDYQEAKQDLKDYLLNARNGMHRLITRRVKKGQDQ